MRRAASQRLLETVGDTATASKDKVEDARKAGREAVNKSAAVARKGVDASAEKTQTALDAVAAKSAEFKAADKPEEKPAEAELPLDAGGEPV